MLIHNFHNILRKIVATTLAIGLFGCSFSSRQELKEYKQTLPFFGTYLSIYCLYTADKDIHSIIERCWERIFEIQESMNAHSSRGEIARINKSGAEGVTVNEELYRLLSSSIEYSRLSDGAFDITILPLIKLWKDASENEKLPDASSLAEAMRNVGYHHIELRTNNRVMFKNKGIKIDLGAIAKGYAVDQIAKILNKNGINDYLLEAGGDILCRGKNKDGVPWRIGIQDPLKRDGIVEVLNLPDAAVTTSGNYERFYTIGEKRFSHIIDPVSGYPQDKVISATVIAKTAEQADAFSTTLCVMDPEKGIRLIESLASVEAMVIEQEKGELVRHQTVGYNKYKD